VTGAAWRKTRVAVFGDRFITAALKTTQLVEISRWRPDGGPAFVYRLTANGVSRALLCSRTSHYVGVAPVPLPPYDAYMRAFALRHRRPPIASASGTRFDTWC
jgi:hypothetical protein